MKIKYAELVNPLFLAGTNLGTKLDIKRKPGLTLKYDSREKEFIVVFNGQTAHFPNFQGYFVESTEADEAKDTVKPVIGFMGKIKAQVSAPNGLKID